jgi:hypothetical protein
MTTTKPKWQKCRAMFMRLDYQFWTHIPTHIDGVILGSLAVIHAHPDDGRKYPWSIVHQPSGKTLCATRTRRAARQFVESLAERFELSAIDRHAANETEQPGDFETLQQIRAFVRAAPGVS